MSKDSINRVPFPSTSCSDLRAGEEPTLPNQPEGDASIGASTVPSLSTGNAPSVATGSGSEIDFFHTAHPPREPFGTSFAPPTSGYGSWLNSTPTASSMDEPQRISPGRGGVSQSIYDQGRYVAAHSYSASDRRLINVRGIPEWSSSSSDTYRVGGLPHHANFIPSSGGEVTANISQSQYNPMIYDATAAATAFRGLQPQNVNYSQQYIRGNYGVLSTRGQAVSSTMLSVPFQSHLVSPPEAFFNSHGMMYGFSQYARPGMPSPFSMNLRGTVQTPSHGMPRYNPQAGLHLFPSTTITTSPPGFSRMAAVPRRNQPCNFDQPESGSSSLRPFSGSHVPGSSRKRPAQGYLPINRAENQRRTRSRPFLPFSPSSQSVARPQLTPLQVGQSPSHLRQAAPAQPVQHVRSSTENIQGTVDREVHIRWEEEEHQLIGHTCYFCNRDLSLQPEDDLIIHNPQMLPVAAVLPCGHAFHSICLQRVTPSGEASNPPCIICSLGEES
ncbi:hypothetical protein SAY87_016547 [Trapa incisa]|uniref:RING-type domain-containing protein n=1 Tax=Trapa incisa TaxID=236973 RepID=A0AAN7LH41_9MYRT|nr:hypothetical protein SAY87_016547 [Trapa incisa]